MGQDEFVYRSCKLLIQQNSIIFIKIERNNHQIICMDGQELANQLWTKTLNLNIPFEPSGATSAATIKIQFSLHSLRSEIISWLIFGLTLAATFIAINGLLYLNLAKLIANPLKHIANVISDGEVHRIAVELSPKSSFIKEINVLNSILEQMAQKIILSQRELINRERDSITADLARQVAHDIRSPIGALKILKSKLQRELGDKAELMSSAIDRIDLMSTEMLAKSNRFPKVISVLDIANRLSKIVSDFKIKANEKNVDMILDIDRSSTIGYAQLNLLDLDRITTNILENALDASKKNGKIIVSVSVINHVLKINISDEGSGIPQHLLEYFGKREIQSTKPNGNGLGVFNAFNVIESWNGHVTVESMPDLGTKILFSLPILEN